MPITYADIKHKLQPPLDCSEIKDLRGLHFQNRLITNYRGADFRGCVLFNCYPSGLANAIEVNPAQSKEDVTLEDADLSRANLYRAYLEGSSFAFADLSEADLASADLRGADLSFASLQGVNLAGANLTGANLKGADLEGANLQNANLESADLQEANLESTNLRFAKLRQASLQSVEGEPRDLWKTDLRNIKVDDLTTRNILNAASQYKGQYFVFWSPNTDFTQRASAFLDFVKEYNVQFNLANLENCNLSNLDLKDFSFFSANLKGVDFRGADLIGVDFRGADLRGAKINTEDLIWVHIQGADLRGFNFENEDLRSVDMSDANLQGVNFKRANMKHSKFYQADLDNADLEEANLESANLSYTRLQNANLSSAWLYKANLRGADLRGANLEGACLRGSDLNSIKIKNANLTKADLNFAIMPKWIYSKIRKEHPNLKFYPMPLYRKDRGGAKYFEKIGEYNADLCPISDLDDLLNYEKLVYDYVAQTYFEKDYEDLQAEWDKRSVRVDSLADILLDGMRFDKDTSFLRESESKYAQLGVDQEVYRKFLRNPTYPIDMLVDKISAYEYLKNREDGDGDYYWIAIDALAVRDEQKLNDYKMIKKGLLKV